MFQRKDTTMVGFVVPGKIYKGTMNERQGHHLVVDRGSEREERLILHKIGSVSSLSPEMIGFENLWVIVTGHRLAGGFRWHTVEATDEPFALEIEEAFF